MKEKEKKRREKKRKEGEILEANPDSALQIIDDTGVIRQNS